MSEQGRAGEQPVSPCVKICRLDAAEQYCVGCLRSCEEIANWTRYSADEKLSVLRAIAARRS